jgi:arylsulfatase A-like enzyme
LNYFDAHHPYFPPAAEGGSGNEEGVSFGRLPESPAEVQSIKSWWEADKRGLGPREIAVARDAYDRCIASLDRELGRLFEVLERRGLLRETLVIITADHGEHFGEQGLFGHGCSLYLPELHVPLVIVPPEGSPTCETGRVVKEPASLRDLAATIASVVGPLVAAASPFPGRSLLAGPRSPGDLVLSELDAPPESDPNHGASPVCRGPLVSLVDRDFHYIRRSDGREELYDLENDRGETHDLVSTDEGAETLRRFRQLQRPTVSLRLPFFAAVR